MIRRGLLIWLLLPLLIFAAKSSPAESLNLLKSHIEEESLLGDEITSTATYIVNNMGVIAENKKLLELCFKVVESYEKSPKYGALFINDATRKGLSRKVTKGNEIDLAIAAIQQGIIDHIYTSKNLDRYNKILSDREFKTSTYFPGAVTPPPSSKQSHTALIDASNRKSWGSPTLYEKLHARRPTGCYLAPGSIARVIVPESMVNTGYNIRVGAHSWSLEKKPTMKRLDRVSILYPIDNQQMLIGSPLGGGIYIEVPYLADEGIVEVEVINALRTPLFSRRSFDMTTNEEWRESERNNEGAWAEFVTDNFMMQVPSSWIRQLDDAEALMRSWDSAMEEVFTLRGLDPSRFDKTLLYILPDVQMRGSANFPGYPQSNYPYNPHAVDKAGANNWMIKGAEYASWTTFHELGHAIRITKFRGEVEALVNLLSVAIRNKIFGDDIDSAFGFSVGGKSYISLDEVARTWMVSENFRAGAEMNYSNRPGDEFKYQHRGYAKYVDIAELFGWESLERFWYAANEDYEGAKSYFPRDINKDPTDSRILRLSIAAGVDLTPLIHFWGIHPVDAESLEQSIKDAGLAPSEKIYHRLCHYLTIIPKDNDEFKSHTAVVYPQGLKITEKSNPMYGEGWYDKWIERYDTKEAEEAKKSLIEIIRHYYPK